MKSLIKIKKGDKMINLSQFLTKNQVYLFFSLFLPLLLCSCKPTVTITSPEDNATFLSGTEITFSSSIKDIFGGDLDNDSLIWTSDKDGQIGTGRHFAKSDLSEGTHEITVNATNQKGEADNATIIITIWSRTEVTSAEQLLAILNSLTYKEATGNLPISEDITINGTVTLDPYLLQLPPQCINNDNCSQIVIFFNDYRADGIALSSDPELCDEGDPKCDYGVNCAHDSKSAHLTLSYIKLRFRSLLDYGPGACRFIPMVHLMPPSDSPCADDYYYKKCGLDKVCYDYMSTWKNEYCMYCTGLSYQECSCRHEDRIFSNGTDCTFLSYDLDTWVYGQCIEGKCEEE